MSKSMLKKTAQVLESRKHKESERQKPLRKEDDKAILFDIKPEGVDIHRFNQMKNKLISLVAPLYSNVDHIFRNGENFEYALPLAPNLDEDPRNPLNIMWQEDVKNIAKNRQIYRDNCKKSLLIIMGCVFYSSTKYHQAI
jgi:hypothetical protein